MPITAQGGSIRINGVGEVISQPTPVIQKERNFNQRAQKELVGKPAATPAGTPPAQP
jgi:hypothetical protein